MSENKKYYYLKFKENYFDQDHIKVIESMDNGYIYSLILLKLYLKSLKFEGQLKINEYIPYKADKIDILSKVIGHDPDHVMHALNLAKDLGIVEIMRGGEIFIKDIQNFIGHSSTEAERKKAYRKRLKSSNNNNLISGDKNGTFMDKRPPELELKLELDKEIEEIYQTYPTRDHIKKYGSLSNVYLLEDEYNRLISEYDKAIIDRYIESLSTYLPNRKKAPYKNHNAVIRNWLNKDNVAKKQTIEVPENSKIDLNEEWI
jgi:predicted phage replisome organizer